MKIAICLVVMMAAAIPCVAQDVDNVELVKEMIEAINHRELDRLDKFIAQNVVRHCAATPGVNIQSLDEFIQFLKADLAACPDAIQEIDLIFGSGEFVAVRERYIGTQTGQMGPFPPSGKKMELPFIGILRIEDGKIAEIWVEWDNLNALTQLGHFPPKAPPGNK